MNFLLLKTEQALSLFLLSLHFIIGALCAENG